MRDHLELETESEYDARYSSVNRLSPRVGVTSGEENAEMFDEEILTWMTVQVLREDQEPIALIRWACTRAMSRHIVMYAAVSKSFFAIRASLFFFTPPSRTDRTLTLRELSVLLEQDYRPKNCYAFICMVIFREIHSWIVVKIIS